MAVEEGAEGFRLPVVEDSSQGVGEGEGALQKAFGVGAVEEMRMVDRLIGTELRTGVEVFWR